MVQFRKSKKVGPFRFTLSKRGLSTSAGVGPVRVSRGADGKVRRTVSVPGTGVYDTKVVGGSQRKTPQQRTAAPAPAAVRHRETRPPVEERLPAWAAVLTAVAIVYTVGVVAFCWWLWTT